MEHANTPRSSRALTAIAAVLALGSTPLIAQEVPQPATDSAPPAPATAAEAPIVLPQQPAPAPLPTGGVEVLAPASPSATSPSPTPTITLPDVTAPPSAASVTPGSPAPQASAPQPAAAPAPTRQTPGAATPAQSQPRGAAPAETPPVVPTAQAPGSALDGTLAEGDAAPPQAADAAQRNNTAAPQAEPANDSTLPLAGIAALLAALGIAGAGGLAMARRRRRPAPHTFPKEQTYAPQPAARREDPHSEKRFDPDADTLPGGRAHAPQPVVISSAPAPREPIAENRPALAIRPANPDPARADAPLPSGKDRRELLERMVAAAPDEANPFTSRKARRRRARILLQHRAHLEEQGRGRGADFDWRTYRPKARDTSPNPSDLVSV